MADLGDKMWKDLSCVALKKFVDKKVNILLFDNTRKVGWVHVVDPVTHTIVLMEQNEETEPNTNSLTVVLGHSILQVCVEEVSNADDRPDINRFLVTEEKLELSEDELQRKKTELIAWLTKNRVPVSESEENSSILSVMGVLFVEPPYGPDCCRCANEIILDRIQKLIRACSDPK